MVLFDRRTMYYANKLGHKDRCEVGTDNKAFDSFQDNLTAETELYLKQKTSIFDPQICCRVDFNNKVVPQILIHHGNGSELEIINKRLILNVYEYFNRWY